MVVDFDEIFSHVVNMSSIHTILGLAVSLDLEIEQLDIKTTSSHRDLEEEIYMEKSKYFLVKDKEHMVCKLKKHVYGLKQVPCNGTKSLILL